MTVRVPLLPMLALVFFTACRDTSEPTVAVHTSLVSATPMSHPRSSPCLYPVCLGPSFPPIANHKPGCATFRFTVGASGKSYNIRLMRPSGNKEFDNGARVVLSREVFTPRKVAETFSYIFEYTNDPMEATDVRIGTPMPGCI
jgi:hypothetical protein